MKQKIKNKTCEYCWRIFKKIRKNGHKSEEQKTVLLLIGFSMQRKLLFSCLLILLH